MNNPHEELEALLLEWESGSNSPDVKNRIRELLRNNPAAQRRFAELQALSVALRLEGDITPTSSSSIRSTASEDSVRSTEKESLRPSKRTAREHFLRVSYWFATCAAVLVFALTTRLIYLELSRPNGTQTQIASSSDPELKAEQTLTEPTSSGVAILTRLVDVTWDSEDATHSVGDALLPGLFAIESGFAQIEFFCGATVILEGPAELNLASNMRARVRRGRLRAEVPPAARGFLIDVDDMQVVDLGTEFGLAVTPDGTEIQVFDGEVEIHRPSSPKQVLVAGKAVSKSTLGELRNENITPEAFTDVDDLESKFALQRSARFEAWRESADSVDQDERLIAHYRFEPADLQGRRLLNRSLPTNRLLDGAIVGARSVEGRWPTKQALEFKQPGDRMRVQIPGQYESLTFAAWVKIDSLDRQFNSLFLTDGYDKGEPHWQLLDSGRLYFSVRPSQPGEEGPVDFKALSPPFWKPSFSGRWMHLATTFDVQERIVAHYLNGESLCQIAVPDENMVESTRIGAASIGNWSMPTQTSTRFAIRNLNGSIDELLLFDAALSASEIRGLYEAGKP